MIFKEGDKVRIKKDSDFIHQNKGIGRITNNPKSIRNNSWVNVVFEDGYSNDYPIKDLESAEEPKMFIFRK